VYGAVGAMETQSQQNQPLLRATGLSKRFGRIEAVDCVNLELSAGEVLCVIGPNGAGKTTLLLLLGGVLFPSAGHMSVFGMDRWRDSFRIRQQSTFLTDTPIFGASETPYEFLRFLCADLRHTKGNVPRTGYILATSLQMMPYLRKRGISCHRV
jgi:ABC-type multidrug transport system ATPase subunit